VQPGIVDAKHDVGGRRPQHPRFFGDVQDRLSLAITFRNGAGASFRFHGGLSGPPTRGCAPPLGPASASRRLRTLTVQELLISARVDQAVVDESLGFISCAHIKQIQMPENGG